MGYGYRELKVRNMVRSLVGKNKQVVMNKAV